MKCGGIFYIQAEEGRGTDIIGVVFTQKLEVLAILKGVGERKNLPPFRRGGAKRLTPP